MPMRTLTLANVAQTLAERIASSFDQLVTDPQRPDRGAFIHPDWGLPSPGSSAALIASCALLYLHSAASPTPHPKQAVWLARARLAAEGLLRAQRPSGLIDLASCNYDSAPDTGFAVQRLCPLVELGRLVAPREPEWERLVELVETFVRRAVGGMQTGGFHTPNHRWVIASALAYAAALWPDLDAQELRTVVKGYVSEGFDVDAEGAFIEHSVGVYDAVCDRSLLLLAEHWPDEAVRAAALRAVRANLDLDLHLLHADGTAETGLSRRQDRGTRRVPLSLAGPYMHAAQLLAEPRFTAAAEMLWRSAPTPDPDALNWLAYALYKVGDPALPHDPSAALPDDYARLYPLNGIWRARRGALSATLFRGGTRLLSLVYGQAELSALKISQSYFSNGRFIGERLEAEGETATLHTSGLELPHRPGYDLPLGQPVPPDRWREMVLEREYVPFPRNASSLTVTRSDEGLELRYRTLDNYPGVVTQLALDFAPGGIWETADTAVQPQAGQVLFLKRGYGTMRYGNDVIRVGPGAFAHRTWEMRNAETAPDCVRVLFTFQTPVDHHFSLHVAHEPYGVQSA
jgi:hypothetical protein